MQPATFFSQVYSAKAQLTWVQRFTSMNIDKSIVQAITSKADVCYTLAALSDDGFRRLRPRKQP
jgi:hypothetical protein